VVGKKKKTPTSLGKIYTPDGFLSKRKHSAVKNKWKTKTAAYFSSKYAKNIRRHN
jgi:hypothetical protein